MSTIPERKVEKKSCMAPMTTQQSRVFHASRATSWASNHLSIGSHICLPSVTSSCLSASKIRGCMLRGRNKASFLSEWSGAFEKLHRVQLRLDLSTKARLTFTRTESSFRQSTQTFRVSVSFSPHLGTQYGRQEPSQHNLS